MTTNASARQAMPPSRNASGVDPPPTAATPVTFSSIAMPGAITDTEIAMASHRRSEPCASSPVRGPGYQVGVGLGHVVFLSFGGRHHLRSAAGVWDNAAAPSPSGIRTVLDVRGGNRRPAACSRGRSASAGTADGPGGRGMPSSSPRRGTRYRAGSRNRGSAPRSGPCRSRHLVISPISLGQEATMARISRGLVRAELAREAEQHDVLQGHHGSCFRCTTTARGSPVVSRTRSTHASPSR